MEAYIPISLKRIAVQRMNEVESGALTRHEAEQSIRKICRLSREELTVHLTREYDREAVQALQYFGLL